MPTLSVPKTWAPLGGCKKLRESVSVGEKGAMTGARIARMATITTIT
jgi:hypothetical protein